MSAAITSSPLGSASRSSTEAPAVLAASRRNAIQMEGGQAISLRADCARLLVVRQGRVWVTRDATVRRATEDLVLRCGESMHVAAGERIVMEPWDAGGATCSWDVASPGQNISR